MTLYKDKATAHEIKLYQSMVRSLMYLATNTRLDIVKVYDITCSGSISHQVELNNSSLEYVLYCCCSK
jgi:hypothetical protein